MSPTAEKARVLKPLITQDPQNPLNYWQKVIGDAINYQLHFTQGNLYGNDLEEYYNDGFAGLFSVIDSGSLIKIIDDPQVLLIVHDQVRRAIQRSFSKARRRIARDRDCTNIDQMVSRQAFTRQRRRSLPIESQLLENPERFLHIKNDLEALIPKLPAPHDFILARQLHYSEDYEEIYDCLEPSYQGMFKDFKQMRAKHRKLLVAAWEDSEGIGD